MLQQVDRDSIGFAMVCHQKIWPKKHLYTMGQYTILIFESVVGLPCLRVRPMILIEWAVQK